MCFPRQALHARKLALTHPQTGQIMQWEVAVPDDIDHLVQALLQYSGKGNVQ